MQQDRSSLLYCAYAIAVFDLLCGVLFAAFSLTKCFSYLTWLAIFAVCFGLFWITLIALLISGIYWRNPTLVGSWLVFSCVGIAIEICLLIYAFISRSTFQVGIAKNSLILLLGLFVETIFVLIIYLFYRELPECSPLVQDKKPPPCRDPPLEQVLSLPQEAPLPKPDPEPEPDADACTTSPNRSKRSYRCNILQTRSVTSPYTCGSKRSPYWSPVRTAQ
ncbi:hypothetical protein AWZ03_002261 [Drosophila navojoa]|uniref:MARVEL domain-containing protein n=1 Tax=Drosophila navojoa TaxID=7232 RepID=A0A484BR73_DRONA|nr:uncharacterized protein LOC108650315 [Drosophila navojoa]TDG51174.1 hypothetical protein AWZ03_002261 [Drosophila navojoa]